MEKSKDVLAFRSRLEDTSREGVNAVERMLAENPDAAADYLQADHVEFARVLSVASARVLGGQLEHDQASSIARTLADQPSYLARLLTGVGA
jgi:hypothetical protein